MRTRNDLTVLLPVYNGLPFLEEAIESLRRQTHRDYIAYIVDDASTDASAEFVRSLRDDRFRLVRSDRTRGIPANWNHALTFVESPYFVLAHQDDVYDPRFLDAMLGIITSHPRAFIAHCKVEAIDEAGTGRFVASERYKHRFWPADDPYERARETGLTALGKANYIVMPSVIYRTTAVRQIGPFAEAYRFVPDWHYWFRGLLAGFTIVGTHRTLLKRRWHRRMATRRAEADFTRYLEEIALAQWIAQVSYEAGLCSSRAADYTMVGKLVLSEFAARLARGEAAEARQLLSFATHRIPGFRGSLGELAAWAASPLGRFGGTCLELAGMVYVRAAVAIASVPRIVRHPFLGQGAGR